MNAANQPHQLNVWVDLENFQFCGRVDNEPTCPFTCKSYRLLSSFLTFRCRICLEWNYTHQIRTFIRILLLVSADVRVHKTLLLRGDLPFILCLQVSYSLSCISVVSSYKDSCCRREGRYWIDKVLTQDWGSVWKQHAHITRYKPIYGVCAAELIRRNSLHCMQIS